MTNQEHFEELKLRIRNLDNLITAEVRKLKHLKSPLKTEHFKTYHQLTKRRNNLLNMCIAALTKMTDLKSNSVDRVI